MNVLADIVGRYALIANRAHISIVGFKGGIDAIIVLRYRCPHDVFGGGG